MSSPTNNSVNVGLAGSTGGGAFVGSSSPTINSPALVTPALGTPASGVLTNCTGTASGLTAGNVTTNANLTGVITSVGNATSIASQTGTGTKFVVDTSPTLVTPVLGVATGTSLSVTSTITSTGGAISTNYSSIGADSLIQVVNSDNTNSASNSVYRANVAGASGGDPKVIFTVGGATDWCFGVDNSDSDKLKWDLSDTIGAATKMSLDSSGNLNLPALTASAAVATNSSKSLVSVTNTGSGNNVLATSPTITTPVISSITNTGTLTLPTATGTVWASGTNNVNTTQAAFLAKPASDAFSVTGDGTQYTLVCGTEIYDQGNNFSSATFTAPVTGRYLFCYSIYAYSVGTQNSVEVYLNASNRQLEMTRAQAANMKNNNSQLIVVGSQMVDMDAADTCTVSIILNGSTKAVNIAAGSYFSGALIC